MVTKVDRLPSKKNLSDALEQANAPVSLSQVHGMIVGMICGGMPLDGVAWKKPLVSMVNNDDDLSDSGMDALEKLTQISSAWFEERISIQLMLPDSEQPLEKRVEGLSQWCDGWLTGFGQFISSSEHLSVETQETLGELVEITQVSLELSADDVPAEESEKMYQDVAEHVRLSVEYIFDECGSAQNGNSIH